MKTFLVCAIAVMSSLASAQHLVKQETFDAIANEYSGEAAQENTRRIVEYHRIQGSPMMAAVAHEVVETRLQNYQILVFLEQFPSDGKTKYGTYTSPMGWDIRSGELWVEGVGDVKDFKPILLCRYSEVPMCVSTYSKDGNWVGELVDVGSGTSDADYKDKDLRGKIALASGYAANVVRQAVLKHGAVGVVIYPDAADRPDHPDMIRYNGIWPRAEERDKTSGGFQISRNQYDMLKSLMKTGAVRVHGNINASLAPGKLTLVHAYIRGTEHPEREILITGHLDHPKWSANDNASGSGAMMEAVRTLQKLIWDKKLAAPKITIHFMWVPEYFGTLAYVSNHQEARSCNPSSFDDPRKQPTYAVHPGKSCVLANINMDMVGEDTVKTNSRFYFTKSPDSVPSFLDGLLTDVLAQTREANLYAPTGTRNYWLPEAIPYAQGSDHDVFLGLGIPATMLGHDPDWTHHTSEDKIDKTDASEFRRVGTFASAAAYWLASADAQAWDRLQTGTVAARIQELSRRLAVDRAVPVIQASIRRIKLNEAEFERQAGSLRVSSRHNVEDFTLSNTCVTSLNGDDCRAHSRTDRSQTIAAISRMNSAGPSRANLLLPLDASAYENLSPEDATWLAEQEARFSSDSEGLATRPNFGLISFEAINFMDGHRSTSEIADLLSAEYLIDIDQAWVERLVSILEKQKLVAK
jgi:aminopeptidase YwaD